VAGKLVLTRGQSCSRAELDLGFKSDQKLYERIAVEYNKKGVDGYDRVQCQLDLAPNNLPQNFTEIEWRSVSKIWKECVYKVEQAVAWKNRSGNSDSDDDEENGDIDNFIKLQYVKYWYLLSEEHPSLFHACSWWFS
jgi:hypothetical protein